MTAERIAIYPGTFDPVTNGHLDIIGRGTVLVDKLIVGVAVNAGKGPLFALSERVALLEEEIRHLPPAVGAKIEVRPFQSLLIRFAEECRANVILRGLRAVSDFEYEFQMAGMNHRLNPRVETVFLMASETHQFISSRFVKEIARLGGDVTSFVSKRVAARMAAQFAAGESASAGDAGAPTLPQIAPRTPL
ncbi:MAG: pantetheine-phosphate adenylyltransferase [Alphaproteobacteria bacterium]|nr:pantetheine-phosphate adenylyltransferase [Alphaproteobacteria bacterium]